MSPTPALAVDALAKEFAGGVRALDGVSLEVRPGEFFALLGPNGAGKTTLISILGGLARPTAGTASVMGHDVVRDSMAVRRCLGIVPQEVIFDPFFTTRQYLKQQSSYYGIHGNDDWIDELLDNLGLTEQADTNTRKLSGGMKRRMMVAMALVHKPALVVLDEPTAGVDVSQRRNLWDFIKRLNAAGTTVILTTHYLDEAEENCGRIVMLDHGKVLADAPTEELLTDPRLHSRCLHLRLADGHQLPDGLPLPPAGDGPTADGRHHFRFDGYHQVEEMLAHLRTHGVEIAEMELAAADLEEVFVALTAPAQR